MLLYLLLAVLAHTVGVIVAARTARGREMRGALPGLWGGLAMLLAYVSAAFGSRAEVGFQLGWAGLAVGAGFVFGLASPWLGERAERLWLRLNPSGFHVALALVAAASVVVLLVGFGPYLFR